MGSMTEKDLIKFGFTKVVINDAESQNGYDYYYYVNKYCEGLTLHSCDNIDVENNTWYVSCHEIPGIRIQKPILYKRFIWTLDKVILDGINTNECLVENS
jgi:hypothetical protein